MGARAVHRDLSAPRLSLRPHDGERADAAGLRAGRDLPRPGRGRLGQGRGRRLMLDDAVRAVLARLEAEDADERARGLPREARARQVAPTTGQFLFAYVSPQTACEVLELGGSRGYSTIWLAAGVRTFGGRVLSLEHDPVKVDAWERNI